MKKVLNLFIKHEQKLRKSSIPWIVILLTTAGHAYGSSKLAEIAGMSKDSLEYFVDRLIEIETTTGNYTTVNPRSGAYGRYQILPSTASYYANKLNIPEELWKEPSNQDKIFQAILKDNIKNLKKNGHEISAFTLYATHQQGARGFNAIMKGKPITKSLEKNLRMNLPGKLQKVKKSQLRVTWINYWKSKLS